MTATNDDRRGRHAGALTAVLFGLAAWCVIARPARGCSIPVFQYALARWPAGAYRVVIRHHGALSPEVKQLAEVQRAGEVNITVRTEELARKSNTRGAGNLTSMIVYYPTSAKIEKPAFAGPVTDTTIGALTDSPVRRELVRRLIAGHASVWLLLESGRKAADDAAATVLAQQLAKSDKTLKLPVPPGRTILVKFSMLRVSRSDLAERVLKATLVGTEPDLRKSTEPMAFCVFGRGRAMPALVGKGIDAQNVREYCAFVTGMCSCQVKSLCPGVDLLLRGRWTQRSVAPKGASDPAKLRLKIAKPTIAAPGVEKQCSGTFVVRNVGPAYRTPPHVIGPSYGIFILDARGKRLFRNYGSWGPGMKAGGQIAFRWDTHSNHLGQTSEPAFLIPAPGKYTLRIELYAPKRTQVLDVSTTHFEVNPER